VGAEEKQYAVVICPTFVETNFLFFGICFSYPTIFSSAPTPAINNTKHVGIYQVILLNFNVNVFYYYINN
jgi:hypothetical protein